MVKSSTAHQGAGILIILARIEYGERRRKMDDLLIENGLPMFKIEVTEKDRASVSFRVYEISCWDMQNKPIESEIYLTGYIKWDGCSHIWFGDEDNEGRQNGYVHLCGLPFWERHSKMMTNLYDYAKKNILGPEGEER